VATPAAVKPAAKPASKTAKPIVRKPAPAPAPAEEPWFMQPWVWAAAGGAILLLILLALLGRRRKPAAPRSPSTGSSLADRFGVLPDAPAASADPDQDELLDQLAEHPDDIGLHLELVSLYYSRRDVEHFEAAAEAMHAHIVDPQQDEWQDVLAMGEDLVPGHPLFAQAGQAEADEFASHEDDDGQDREALRTFDLDSYASDAEETQSPAAGSARPKVSEYHFDFNLTPPPLPQAAASDPADDDRTILRDVEPAAEPATSSWNFEEPVNETGVPAAQPHESGQFSDDPIDTKLDLARAYMDMGDADGARAMLEEVMNEGSQMQRDAAQRLIDSLG
jgi:pilus assembly protein FimV